MPEGLKSTKSAGKRWGPKRPSDFSSDFVTHGSALLGIVAASTKREALNLEACRDTSPYGVLGVECSNHSVPTIFFNDLGQCPRHWPFSFSGDFRGFSDFHPCLLFKIVRTGPLESVADTIFAASISCPSSAPE